MIKKFLLLFTTLITSMFLANLVFASEVIKESVNGYDIVIENGEQSGSITIQFNGDMEALKKSSDGFEMQKRLFENINAVPLNEETVVETYPDGSTLTVVVTETTPQQQPRAGSYLYGSKNSQDYYNNINKSATQYNHVLGLESRNALYNPMYALHRFSLWYSPQSSTCDLSVQTGIKN